jgi:hypothetical protein
MPVNPQVEEIVEEEQMHGAAPEQQPLKVDDQVAVKNNTGSVKTPVKAYDELRDSLEDRSAFLNMVFEYLLAGKLQQLPE